MSDMKKQYKGTDSKMRCRDFQFEIGKTYTVEGELSMCGNGFHSCDTMWQVVGFYDIVNSRFWEIEASCDLSDGEKNCSRSIRFVRELSFYEVMRALNRNEDGSEFSEGQENTNTGFLNRGNWNHGNGNHGNENRGNGNRGNENRGNENRGNENRGNENRGNWNRGNWNSGNGNRGNWNSGNGNRGNDNTNE